MVSDGYNSEENPHFSLGSRDQIETDSCGIPFIPGLNSLPNPSLLPQEFIDGSLGVGENFLHIPPEGPHTNIVSQQQPQALNPPVDANIFFESSEYQNLQSLQAQNNATKNASEVQYSQNEEPPWNRFQASANVVHNSAIPTLMDVDEPLLRDRSQNNWQSAHNPKDESMDLGADRPPASSYDPLESTSSAVPVVDIDILLGGSEALPSNTVETSNIVHNEMDIEQADVQTNVGPLPPALLCQLCQEAFPSIQMLRRHRADVHPDAKPYFCVICGYTCLGRTAMSKHFVNIHREETSNCNQCNARLQTRTGLQKHMYDMHEEGKEDKCPECTRHFKSKSGLRRHRTQKHNFGVIENDEAEIADQEGDSPGSDDAILPAAVEISCQVCQENFISELLLRQHRADVHPDQKPFICIDCGKEYKSRAKLNTHFIANHKKSALSRCLGCTKLYQTITGREKHYRLEHLEKKRYACPDCAHRYSTPSSLRRHKEDKKHGQFAPLPSNCPIPDGTDSNEGIEEDHAMEDVPADHVPPSTGNANEDLGNDSIVAVGADYHENDPLPSDVVGEQRNYLLSEIRAGEQQNDPLPETRAEGQENDPQPENGAGDQRNEPLAANTTSGTGNAADAPAADALTCSTCSEAFEAAKFLWHHRADRHPEENPFFCLECGHLFNKRYLLRRHCGETHGYGLMRCSNCEQIFQTQDGHNKHYEEKHATKPFACATCGRRYGSQESLQHHQKKNFHGPYPPIDVEIARPFACEDCGTRYVRANSLIAHQREKKHGEFAEQ